ncbi:MAG: phosphoglucosamine mutase, partial [Candidatus Eremiobacteraeota bacterium]|nr:phosphoglucosamine mutase [Candidatus Eremiobacteraeota bacterium]
PTPAVAFLTRRLGAGAGIMISASHNPIEDNGIKLFAGSGCKLADDLEDEIAAQVEAHNDLPRPVGDRVGTIFDRRRSAKLYRDHCVSLGAPLERRTIVVDAAYGAAYDIAPKVFRALGADVVPLHCTADGRRINVDSGATNLGVLRAAVLSRPKSVGVAFDGDADRALFVDERGDEVTGDHVLAILAKELMQKGRLPKDTVVATVMSNLGLELAVAEMGATLLRTAVGDRYVLEAMQAGGYRIGGEQSGHIIDLESNTTGDGIATAARVLSLAVREGSLSSLAGQMRTYPQILVNVRVVDKRRAEEDEAVRAEVKTIEEQLAGHGRILVRPSGTEPLVRIMIEGTDEVEMRRLAQRVVDKIAAA